jgi:GTP-binding protein
VLADIPGLIEGAAEGAGIGDRFLGHVERTEVLLHLVDAAGDDPVEAWQVVRGELESYGAGLAGKPEVIALSRSDLVTEERLHELKRELEDVTGQTPFPISAPLGEGIEPLLDAVIQRLGSAAEVREEAAADERPWSPL